MGGIVRITKYMTDLDEHVEVVSVMWKHFGNHLATSTTVEVNRLVPRGFCLDIDVIATVPTERRWLFIGSREGALIELVARSGRESARIDFGSYDGLLCEL